MKATQNCLLGKNINPDDHLPKSSERLASFHHEAIMHPNLDTSVIHRTASYLLPEGPKHGSFSDGCFAKWFVNFDEKRLRPLLIRNYSVENIIL